MVDCMFAALCTPLAFMGYACRRPSWARCARRLACRASIRSPTSRQGTSTAATKTALRKLMPEAPVVFGGLADDVMLDRLGAGRISVRVTVGSADLPRHLRRFIGFTWVGGHAIALGGARRRGDGTWEVRWMDPAGRPGTGYDGEFVPYAEVKGRCGARRQARYGSRTGSSTRRCRRAGSAQAASTGDDREGTDQRAARRVLAHLRAARHSSIRRRRSSSRRRRRTPTSDSPGDRLTDASQASGSTRDGFRTRQD